MLLLNVGNKICSFKNGSFLFWTRVQFKKGSQVLQNLRVVAQKKGEGRGGEGGQTDLKFFGWAKVKRGEVNISGWGCYPGSHYELSHTFLCSHSLGQ